MRMMSVSHCSQSVGHAQSAAAKSYLSTLPHRNLSLLYFSVIVCILFLFCLLVLGCSFCIFCLLSVSQLFHRLLLLLLLIFLFVVCLLLVVYCGWWYACSWTKWVLQPAPFSFIFGPLFLYMPVFVSIFFNHLCCCFLLLFHVVAWYLFICYLLWW